MLSAVNQSFTGFTHKLLLYNNPKTNSFLCSLKSLKSFVMQLETNRERCLLFLKGSVWESWSSDWISNVLKKNLCCVGALISNWAEYCCVWSQGDLFVLQLAFPLELSYHHRSQSSAVKDVHLKPQKAKAGLWTNNLFYPHFYYLDPQTAPYRLGAEGKKDQHFRELNCLVLVLSSMPGQFRTSSLGERD